MPIVFQRPPAQAVQAVTLVLDELRKSENLILPRSKRVVTDFKLTAPHQIAWGSLEPRSDSLEIELGGWRFALEDNEGLVAAVSARAEGSTYRFSELVEGELVEHFFERLASLAAQQQNPDTNYEPIILTITSVRAVILWLREEDSLVRSLGHADLLLPLYLGVRLHDSSFRSRGELMVELTTLLERANPGPGKGG